MGTLRITANFVLIIVGLVLCLGGLLTMQLEFKPFLASESPVEWRVQEIAAGRIDYGLSTSSRELALADCRRATLSLEVRLQPSAIRSSVYSNCLALSDSFAAIQPTLSIAWLTGAIAAAQMRDWPAFNSRMLRSLRSAPNEQWVAEMRISLFEQYYDQLTDDLRAGNRADMLLLTDNDAGLLKLARIFVASPTSQDRIASVIATRPEVTREKFERRVRLVTEEAGH
ncbi:hypothetical protein [Devosia faecipullorum]|uniref:hypothetical protein n=1 Tax=Devosia faecipullorum TaxID=2755039 RepID=UPI00187B4CE0|nr:hypothetical protein [Devosia faecipullorum]MBE7731958.1 hypothetical protein [Devosia faecipullorum]